MGGGDTITQIISNICTYLSGAPAVGIGTLAIIYSGYEMYHGEIDKKKMLVRCLAIAITIGGAYIGKNILMAGIA